jgi:hypothetical protein
MSNGKGERWKAKAEVKVKVKGMEVGGLSGNIKCQMTNRRSLENWKNEP